MRTKIGLLGLVVVGLVIGSVVSNGAVRADDVPVVKKHHHHHHIHGKITAVDATSITIAVHHHHKKGEAAVAPESKTFQISSTTKVEIVGKDDVKTSGTVADLKIGEHVSIHEHEGNVHEIVVGHHHHHHPKKPVA